MAALIGLGWVCQVLFFFFPGGNFAPDVELADGGGVGVFDCTAGSVLEDFVDDELHVAGSGGSHFKLYGLGSGRRRSPGADVGPVLTVEADFDVTGLRIGIALVRACRDLEADLSYGSEATEVDDSVVRKLLLVAVDRAPPLAGGAVDESVGTIAGLLSVGCVGVVVDVRVASGDRPFAFVELVGLDRHYIIDGVVVGVDVRRRQ